ncbi:MAG: metallopeptidase [Ignavibacteria bacterium]|nr:MAG: metallopeptidase [Ignavibacteria bacterium]KAF0155895.1 MAG: metallopeptidase [Ignavibacteria bacterium]
MKKIFPLLLLIYLPIIAADKFDYNLMQNKIDVLHYSIQLKISDTSSEISASTEITFKAVTDLRELKFNLKDLQVSMCMINNQQLLFEHGNGILTIHLQEIITKYTIHKIFIEYNGEPKTGLFIGKNKYKNFAAFSDNWANYASSWFPSIDHPSDKASVSFFVTVPKKYEVICNGDLVERILVENEKVKYVYNIKEPIPTYCMVVGVCDFAITKTKTKSGIPVYYYTYPEDSLNAVKGFNRAADMLTFYEEIIGTFPFSRLSIVQSSTAFGGMENSSVIFFAEKSSSFTGEKDNEETVAHEIAHQWFGDALTMSDWSEIWLSEGFATYFTALYFEARDGKERFERIMNSYKNTYRQNTNWKTPILYKDYKRISELLNVETYQKAALFLHELRQKIGDKDFFKSIKKYYSKYLHSNVTTKDFKKIVESVSGKNLDSLFAHWLYFPGLPN